MTCLKPKNNNSFFSKLFKRKKKESLSGTLTQINQERADKLLIKPKQQTSLEQKLFSSIKSVSQFFISLYDKNDLDYEHLQEELEETLIKFDFSAPLAIQIGEEITKQLKTTKINNHEDIKKIIFNQLSKTYGKTDENTIKLNIQKKEDIENINVIFVCGSNGVGKTTAIAKIAHMYKKQGYKILLIAGDTFRAGAVAQLKQWADTLNIDIITPEKEKEDPAALIYKAASLKNQYQLIICDTSGRQHNNQNLMKEIEKLHMVIKKFNVDAPQESLLVLDATHGQSAFLQAEAFLSSAKISGIVLNKMDNSNKGGMIFTIKNKYDIPVKLIGVGEKLEDLYAFDIEVIIKKIIDVMFASWDSSN